MTVITLAQVKAQLGLTADTTYDTQISAEIPFIDAKVKAITKQKYNYKFLGDTTLDSTSLSVYDYTNDNSDGRNVSGINNPNYYSDVSEALKIGMLISGDNIPTGAYITDITSQGTSTEVGGVTYNVTYIEISDAVTATESGVELTGGISIAYHDVISKGIFYQIEKKTTTLPTSSLASRSFGPLSVSFSQADQKIDNRYGMPSWFVKGLPRFQTGY